MLLGQPIFGLIFLFSAFAGATESPKPSDCEALTAGITEASALGSKISVVKTNPLDPHEVIKWGDYLNQKIEVLFTPHSDDTFVMSMFEQVNGTNSESRITLRVVGTEGLPKLLFGNQGEFGKPGEMSVNSLYSLGLTAARRQQREAALVAILFNHVWYFSNPSMGSEPGRLDLTLIQDRISDILQRNSQIKKENSEIIIFHTHPTGSPFNSSDERAVKKLGSGFARIRGVVIDTSRPINYEETISFIFDQAENTIN